MSFSTEIFNQLSDGKAMTLQEPEVTTVHFKIVNESCHACATSSVFFDAVTEILRYETLIIYDFFIAVDVHCNVHLT